MSFAALGVAGLFDFWRWGYDYGHNLDFEHAIIKVPGMTYQPPLIGTKQLLNFTAASWPDVGGVLAGVAFALGVRRWLSRIGGRVRLASLCETLPSRRPSPARPGHRSSASASTSCAECRMLVSDARFGARSSRERARR